MTEIKKDANGDILLRGSSVLVHYVADVVSYGVPEAIIMRFTCKSRRKLLDQVLPRAFPAGMDDESQKLVDDFLAADEERWLRLRSNTDYGLIVYPRMRIE